MFADTILIRMRHRIQLQINFLHLVPEQINTLGEARSGSETLIRVFPGVANEYVFWHWRFGDISPL